jgi:hypothetical protein
MEEAPKTEEPKEMELREFVEISLRDIFEGTKDAQRHILYGEIIPNKDGKTGEADIDFEIAVKPKGNSLIVAVQPAPPMQIPNKVKFKIPVRLPKRRGGFLSHLIEYYCMKRRKKKAKAEEPKLPPPESEPASPEAPKSGPAPKPEEQKSNKNKE